jgi:hypothetical protein
VAVAGLCAEVLAAVAYCVFAAHFAPLLCRPLGWCLLGELARRLIEIDLSNLRQYLCAGDRLFFEAVYLSVTETAVSSLY